MLEKTTANQTLGLSLCGHLLKGALLSQHKGEITLDHLFEVSDDFTPLPEDPLNVKPLYIAEVQQLLEGSNPPLIVTGMVTHQVLIRPLEIKLVKDKDIEAVFPFQSEALLPYPLENAVLDKIQLSKDDQATQLSLLAVRRDHLQTHMNSWEYLSVIPEVVSAVPLALAAFAAECDPRENKEDPLFILHLGTATLTCVLAAGEKVLAAHASPAGMQSLIEAAAKDWKISVEEATVQLKEYDFLRLSKEAMPLLHEAVQSLTQNVLMNGYAIYKYAKGQRIDQVLLCGEGSTLKNLAPLVCGGLNKTLLSPENSSWKISSLELQRYAVAIGLALTALPSAQEQINFRQQEFAYPHPWKRYKKLILLYAALSCLAGIGLLIFSHTWFSYKEDSLKEKYAQVLTVINRSYDAVESDYAKKNPGAPVPPSLKEFSRHDLSERLQFVEKQLQANPEIYPLQPNVPRVSDLLAWLSTHANLTEKEAESDNWQPVIQIETLSYSMVKRPELSKKQDKYQVKVEMEFTSPTPKQAREFHDALIAPNDYVDPKGDIKWSASRGKYRTSFYLKDRTTYQVAS